MHFHKIWRRQCWYWYWLGRCCFAAVARSDWCRRSFASGAWPLLWFTIPASVVVGSGSRWSSWWRVWWLSNPSLPWGRHSFGCLAGRSVNPLGGDAAWVYGGGDGVPWWTALVFGMHWCCLSGGGCMTPLVQLCWEPLWWGVLTGIASRQQRPPWSCGSPSVFRPPWGGREGGECFCDGRFLSGMDFFGGQRGSWLPKTVFEV
jgi:hypothetical protein